MPTRVPWQGTQQAPCDDAACACLRADVDGDRLLDEGEVHVYMQHLRDLAPQIAGRARNRQTACVTEVSGVLSASVALSYDMARAVALCMYSEDDIGYLFEIEE